MSRAPEAPTAYLRRGVLRALLAIGLLALWASCPASTKTAQAQGVPRFLDHGVRLVFASTSPVDSQAITASWGAATTGTATATGYRVQIVAGGDRRTASVTTLSAKFRIRLPCPATDSVLVGVTVWGRRAGVEGTDSVWGTRWLKRTRGTCPPTVTSGIDTLSPFRTAGGALRPGVVQVDSATPGRWYVDRLDSAATPYRVWVLQAYRDASTPASLPYGAVITASYSCPLRKTDPVVSPGMWSVPALEAVFPKLVVVPGLSNSDTPDGSLGAARYTTRTALALAAQLPVDSLRELARQGFARSTRADTANWNSRYWYTECHGPTEGITPRPWTIGEIVVTTKQGQWKIPTWTHLYAMTIDHAPKLMPGDTIWAAWYMAYRDTTSAAWRNPTQMAIVKDTVSTISFTFTDSTGAPKPRTATLALYVRQYPLMNGQRPRTGTPAGARSSPVIPVKKGQR